MERQSFLLNLEDTANEMANIFAGELQGYELSQPKLSLIFNVARKDYLPGVTLEAIKGLDTRYLIYSPLANQMLLAGEEGTYLPVTAAAKYHNNLVAAEIIETENGLEMLLSIDETPKLCADAERAGIVVNGFMAMTYESSVRRQYHQLEPEQRTLKPCLALGSLNFVLELKKDKNRVFGIFVDVATSAVRTMGLPLSEYKLITEGARIRNKEMHGYKNYFFNGRKFRPADNESEFMTREEAKEVFDNLPEDQKQQYEANYQLLDMVPVMCCHIDFSYIIGENRSATPPAVLLIDARIGLITEFNVNIDKTVLRVSVGTQFANDGNPVKLTNEGWTSKF